MAMFLVSSKISLDNFLQRKNNCAISESRSVTSTLHIFRYSEFLSTLLSSLVKTKDPIVLKIKKKSFIRCFWKMRHFCVYAELGIEPIS